MKRIDVAVKFLVYISFGKPGSFLNECHSSAFQTISLRPVYFKIINYSGSILGNLNIRSTMQTKQHATKQHIHPQILTLGLFLWWKDSSQKMIKIFIFCYFNNLDCIQNIFISRRSVFLMH